jgi:hypothetical protein
VTGPVWRKSSRSGTQQGACVEVADMARNIAVRDSKNPDGPLLIVHSDDWRSFIRRVKRNEYELG